MLIWPADHDVDLHLLERRHTRMLEALTPGDLAFSQGEWLFSDGGATDWLAAALAGFARGTCVQTGIFRHGVLVGTIALNTINTASASAAIDYCMDARHRNQGIMTAACRAMVTYAFAEVGLNRLQIVPDTANLPSRRIPQKLGFSHEGVLRAYYRTAAGYRDCALYSLLRDEWTAAV
jgi:ribosomal-protein-serine acetyltransferase